MDDTPLQATPAAHRFRRASPLALYLIALSLISAGPAPAAAQRPNTVSRSRDGRYILHRRLPPSGDAPSAEATPIFVYDPISGGKLPRELHRDGQTLPRPEAPSQAAPNQTTAGQTGPNEAGPNEIVYTADGMRDAPADTGTGLARPSPAGTAAAAGDARTEGDAALGATPFDRPGDRPGETDRPDDTEPPSRPGEGAATTPNNPTRLTPAPSLVMDPRATLGDSARPDRDTRLEETLHYRTVFDPSVVPFKRNRALDRVLEGGSLSVDASPVTPVTPIGNIISPGREVFWGSVLVATEANQRLPLPSISPDSQILSYETVPAATATFSKDQADNYYISLDRAGQFRLIFVMDAPTAYFGRVLPRGYTAADVPTRLVPSIPAPLRQEALEVARTLGLSRTTPYHTLVDSLVGYFRSFEPGEPLPPSAWTGSIYRDLALGKRGICRHRGYAFVVTAQGLGVPARYVFNEAHVFVEVWVPGRDAGWIRIDLGGGAEGLVVHGGQDKTLHQPATRDPFARPERYAEQRAQGQTAGAQQVQGLPAANRSATPAIPGGANSGPAASEAIRAAARAAIAQPIRSAAGDGRVPTRTTLVIDSSLVFRGEALRLSGRVLTQSGDAVEEGAVQILLLSGPRLKATARLATVTPGRGGTWRATARIPDDQAPGDYEIVAEFLGTDAFGGSVSK